MEFGRLLSIVGNEPVFETGLLLAGDVDAADVRRQLSRWVKAGRLYLLRRGVYALAPPYQRIRPHPFVVANRISPPSYVSMQSALGFYGLIPDVSQATMSCTAARPNRWQTPLGNFVFRHIQPRLFFGYHSVDLGAGQQAFVATPEKALLDLIYLEPHGGSLAYLLELRLQNLDHLDPDTILRLAERSDIGKLRQAAGLILSLRQQEAEEFGEL